MSQSNNEPPRLNEDRARYVVIDCLDAGKSREEIRRKLMDHGYAEIAADRLIENVEREQRNTAAYDASTGENPWVHMVCGGIIFLLGAGATILSLTMAADSGGVTVVICAGAIAAGAFQFYHGLKRWNRW